MPSGASVQLTYTVRMSDLFWMWLTSWFTPATVAFGLFFISALVAPGDHPRALDVAAGLGLIVAAFTVAPLFWMRITGMSRLAGMSVDLEVGSDGVVGWPIPITGGRPWTRLHRPRVEDRVIVLPFRMSTSPLGWVVIPRRALTDAQLADLIALLRGRGFLPRGRGQSLTGRLLSPLVTRPPQG
jgi:hypothetical protein